MDSKTLEKKMLTAIEKKRWVDLEFLWQDAYFNENKDKLQKIFKKGKAIESFENLEKAVKSMSDSETFFYYGELISFQKNNKFINKTRVDNLWRLFREKVTLQIQPWILSADGVCFREKVTQFLNFFSKSYKELVNEFIKKNGQPQESYFLTEFCSSKNPRITKTGLQIHHIKEDEVEALSNPEIASEQNFDFQKSKNLVYVNILEHFILHSKIWLENDLSFGGLTIIIETLINNSDSRKKYKQINSYFETIESSGFDLKDFDILITLIAWLKPHPNMFSQSWRKHILIQPPNFPETLKFKAGLTTQKLAQFKIIKDLIEEIPIYTKKTSKTDPKPLLAFFKNSFLADAKNPIVANHHLIPTEYQNQAIAGAKKHEDFVLPMSIGSGKTFTAAMIAENWKVDNLLVIAPPKVLRQWQKAFPPGQKIDFLTPQKATKNVQKLTNRNIIFDEFQILTNPKNAAFNFLKDLLISTNHLCLVSGSPINWPENSKKWLLTWKLLYKNLNSTKELKLHEINFFEEVKKKAFFFKLQLPVQKQLNEIVLKTDDVMFDVINRFHDEFGNFLYNWPMNYHFAVKTNDYILSQKTVILSEILLKKPSSAIFYTYKKEKNTIISQLSTSLKIFEISGSKNELDDFLKCSNSKTILIQPSAGGVGIDGLQTQINNLIFFSIPMTLEAFSQATGRIIRKNQDKNVNVFLLMSEIENSRWKLFYQKNQAFFNNWKNSATIKS